MTTIRRATFLSLLALLTAGCRSAAQPPSPSPVGKLMISEVMAGEQGNNNHEFIELYNAGSEMRDMQGWSLWYRLATSDEDLLVYRWEAEDFIPAGGHYLLVRRGQDVGRTPDAVFDQSLNTSGGGLSLRDGQGVVVDSFGWGKAPPSFVEGQAAPALENGISLERRSAEAEGRLLDQDDNASDFAPQDQPTPENVGSGPVIDLALVVHAPEDAAPGSDLTLQVEVANRADAPLSEVTVTIPIPAELQVASLPPDWSQLAGAATWSLASLAGEETRRAELTFTSPWIYTTIRLANVRASAEDVPPTLAAPAWISIKGGSIPIGIARTLRGSPVTVEGVATMYTGGFFAGAGNVKFYLEDENAGVQVWVPKGEGEVELPLGARVRVSGEMDAYRGAMELIVGNPDDVVLFETGAPPAPLETTLQQALYDHETLPGRLIAVEGLCNRIEEFSYSYEVDLIDEAGGVLTLYIDKNTGMSVEPLEIGHRYQAVGILDLRDGSPLLYPRQQNDLQEIFPPELALEVSAPITALPGDVLRLTLTLNNHTKMPVKDVRLQGPAELPGLMLIQVEDGGQRQGDDLVWVIPDLEANGAAVEVHAQFRVSARSGLLQLEGFTAEAPDAELQSSAEAAQVFIGDSLPIWAIQGAGFVSPYKLQWVTTRGVVSGVFPELGGFWIESTASDDDPATSEGLFIAFEGDLTAVKTGDLVEVYGQVREISGQTELHPASSQDVHVLPSGETLLQPVELDPPADEEASHAYFEALEGMLVSLSGPATVLGPTSRFGETVIALPGQTGQHVFRGDETGMLITVDDGSEIAHEDGSTLPYALAVGDQIGGLLGPLAYTFGDYKIEPLEAPWFERRPIHLPSAPPAPRGEISVMTWNVENLFDILDPHPASPPRPRKADYDRALTKVAATIQSAGMPAIVAVQEVENLGILEDLAAHPLLAQASYEPILVEGSDSRGIDVGYLVRTDQAEILSVEQRNAPEGLTSRPPLLIKVRLLSGGKTLYVVNNHFTSLAGGEAATETRRDAQAAWNASIAKTILASDPQAAVIVLGDLNSFYASKPLETLHTAGLSDVFDTLPADQRYTYIYRGVAQTLDHILASPWLLDRLADVRVLHTNADYPLPDPSDESPLHKSDHDAVIAYFQVGGEP